MSSENIKNKELILFILKNRWESSVTAILKILYLIDLRYLKETWNKLSEFNYVRYNYGPFDKRIYDLLDDLLQNTKIGFKIYTTPFWDEITRYTITNTDESLSIESDLDLQLAIDSLNDFSGFNASDLTKIAYKTKPMLDLWAEIWNTKWYNEKLI